MMLYVYREDMKLKVVKIGRFKIYFRNKEELDRIKKEVFIDEEYKFTSKNRKPFIIDCGSHIGLSILYFKSIYPEAEVLGFEPNPQNFEIIQKNIKENKLKGVKVINAALSDKDAKDTLRVSFEEKEPWTWGDTIVKNMWGDEDDNKKIEVRTVRLSRYINKPVDLLKLDVEGSEQKVLEEIKDKLHFIKQINMEFHGTPTNKKINSYKEINKLLKDNMFKIRTYTKDKRFPFPGFVACLRNIAWIFSVKATRG